MQCHNTTIEWIDCEILVVAKNRCAAYTRAIGTNTVFRLRICSLNTTVFIHLNPFNKTAALLYSESIQSIDIPALLP